MSPVTSRAGAAGGVEVPGRQNLAELEIAGAVRLTSDEPLVH